MVDTVGELDTQNQKKKRNLYIQALPHIQVIAPLLKMFTVGAEKKYY